MDGRPLLDGPVALEVEFRPAPRPARHWLPVNARRLLRVLRLDAPVWHASTPDIDKLCRAVLDALTSVAWVDDRQVARLVASKRWPDEGEAPGASIRVRRLEATR
jgi:Holliday junction resolvase RusA-like endonuclease